MKNRITLLIAIALLIVNGLFFWQNYTLKKTLAAIPSDSASYLVNFDGHSEDMRGVYTYPGVGAMFTDENEVKNPPLTLVIFFSKAIKCPMSLKEMEVYNRLLPIYEARNQKLIAICPTEDSTAIRELLEKKQLPIPLISTDSLLNCSFFQLGI